MITTASSASAPSGFRISTGVVCGHIHKAEIRSIGDVLYCNDGDWVESLTALVEGEDGELSILHWKEIARRATTAVAAAAEMETTIANFAGD